MASVLLYISAIFSFTAAGEYFISFTNVELHSSEFIIFRDHPTFLNSDYVNSVDIGVGNTFCIGVAFV